MRRIAIGLMACAAVLAVLAGTARWALAPERLAPLAAAWIEAAAEVTVTSRHPPGLAWAGGPALRWDDVRLTAPGMEATAARLELALAWAPLARGAVVARSVTLVRPVLARGEPGRLWAGLNAPPGVAWTLRDGAAPIWGVSGLAGTGDGAGRVEASWTQALGGDPLHMTLTLARPREDRRPAALAWRADGLAGVLEAGIDTVGTLFDGRLSADWGDWSLRVAEVSGPVDAVILRDGVLSGPAGRAALSARLDPTGRAPVGIDLAFGRFDWGAVDWGALDAVARPVLALPGLEARLAADLLALDGAPLAVDAAVVLSRNPGGFGLRQLRADLPGGGSLRLEERADEAGLAAGRAVLPDATGALGPWWPAGWPVPVGPLVVDIDRLGWTGARGPVLHARVERVDLSGLSLSRARRPAAGAPPLPAGPFDLALRVGSLRLAEGEVADARASLARGAEGFSGDFGAADFLGARTAASFSLGDGVNGRFAVSARAGRGRTLAPLLAAFGLRLVAAPRAIEATGSGTPARAALSLSAEGPDFSARLEALLRDGALRGPLELRAGPMGVAAELRRDAAGLRFEDAVLWTGASRLEGAAALACGRTDAAGGFDIALTAETLGPEALTGMLPGLVAGTRPAGTAARLLGALGPCPADVTTGRVAVARLDSPAGPLADARLAWRADAAGLAIEEARARLAGGTLEAGGTLPGAPGSPPGLVWVSGSAIDVAGLMPPGAVDPARPAGRLSFDAALDLPVGAGPAEWRGDLRGRIDAAGLTLALEADGLGRLSNMRALAAHLAALSAQRAPLAFAGVLGAGRLALTRLDWRVEGGGTHGSGWVGLEPAAPLALSLDLNRAGFAAPYARLDLRGRLDRPVPTVSGSWLKPR